MVSLQENKEEQMGIISTDYFISISLLKPVRALKLLSLILSSLKILLFKGRTASPGKKDRYGNNLN